MLLIIVLIPSFGLGQSKITTEYVDSVYDSGEQLGLKKDLKAQQAFFKQIDSLARSIGYAKGMLKANIGLAYNYRFYNPDISMKYILVVDSIFKNSIRTFDPVFKMQHYLIKGFTLGNMQDRRNEVKYYLKVDSMAQEHNDDYYKHAAYHYLTHYYHHKEELDMELLYNRKLLKYYGSNRDSFNFDYLITLNNIGFTFYGLKEYDSTIHYVEKVLKEGFMEMRDPSSTAFAYQILALAYLQKDNLEMGEKYYLKLKEHLTEVDRYNANRMNLYLVQNQLHLKRGQYNAARKAMYQAKEIVDSLNMTTYKEDVYYYYLNSNLLALDQTELAQVFNEYKVMRDSIFNIASDTYEKQLLVQYQTAEKEEAALRANHLRKLANQKLENNRTKLRVIITAGSSIIIILILSGAFIVFRNRTRKKNVVAKPGNTKVKRSFCYS